jgi:hypothetical protein
MNRKKINVFLIISLVFVISIIIAQYMISYAVGTTPSRNNVYQIAVSSYNPTQAYQLVNNFVAQHQKESIMALSILSVYPEHIAPTTKNFATLPSGMLIIIVTQK